MSTSDYLLCLVGAATFFIIGVGLLIVNRIKKKDTGKSDLPLILVGWSLIAIALIGAIIATIISTFETTGTTGVILLIALGGIFIVIGLILFLGLGVSSLLEGCRKDKNGMRSKEEIVRGATFLFLAVAVAITVIVTIAIMMHIESNKEKPVRMMINLLWIVKNLTAF